MASSEDSDLKIRAKEWIDGVNAATGLATGWRLQILRLRSKRKFGKDPSALPEPDTSKVDSNGGYPVSVEHVPEAGECPDLPVRLRRFVPGCPWELVDEAIRYLHRIAPYRDIVYNGIPVQGVYRPLSTTWQRDEQSLSPGERGALGTYTLIQDLVEVTACPDELDAFTSSSCQSDEETVFVWDADSVEPVPVTCEQGVTWEVRAVSRDDDGQFSYQLVKRTAKTVAWGPRVVECGDLSETMEWGWRNAYGSPDSSLEAHLCGSDVPTPIELPACDSTGVTTQTQTQMNADCTWDVTVRQRTSKHVTESWVDGTACRAQTTVHHENSRGVPAIPNPAPGERVSADFRINEDRTLSGRVTMTEAPEPLSWSWVDGTQCRPVRHEEWRDQVEKPALPEAAPGETLSAEYVHTEDCLWNASFRTVAARPQFSFDWTEGTVCRPEERSVRLGVLEPPSPSEFEPPSDGGRVQASVSMNEDCTYDWSRSVVRPADEWVGSWTDGSQCRPRDVMVWQDAKTLPVVPTAGAGETVVADFTRSNDCTYSGRVSVSHAPEPFSAVWVQGTACRPETVRVLEGLVEQPTVAPPAAGESVSARVSRSEDCLYSLSETRRGPRAGASDPFTWTDGTACRPVDHSVYTDAPGMPVVPVAGVGETVSASFRMGDDCTFTGEVAKSKPAPADTGWITWDVAPGRGYSQQHGYRTFAHLDSLPASLFPVGVSMQSASVSLSRSDDCTYSGSVQYETPVSGGPAEGADLKFIRHGPQVPVYIYDHDPYKRKHAYRVVTLHATFHYGDAYTDFVSDKLRSTRPGNQEIPSEGATSGVVAVRLAPGFNGHSIWTDSAGNVVCAWVSVDYNAGAYDNWTDIRSRDEMKKFKDLVGAAEKGRSDYASILQELLLWRGD